MEAAEQTRKPYQQAARDLLRDSLLDAAADLLQDRGWSAVSMAAISERAGVSRQTLYNEFGSREQFAQAYALREADRFLVLVEAAFMQHADSPLAALRQGFFTFLDETTRNPMVRQIIVRDPGADELLALFTSQGGPVVTLATIRLTARICDMWPEAATSDVQVLAEMLVRLGISYAGLPKDTNDEAADQVVTLAGPFVLQALGIDA